MFAQHLVLLYAFLVITLILGVIFFFFNDTATTEIYTLSLHDALPILGYIRYRILGATLVGLAFIWPSFLMVVALGCLYTLYGGLPWMQAVFYGVGASVIGIIAHSAYKLTTKTIGRDWLL